MNALKHYILLNVLTAALAVLENKFESVVCDDFVKHHTVIIYCILIDITTYTMILCRHLNPYNDL